jgi:transposase
MDLIYDLLTGIPICQGVHSGTMQDKTIGKIILDLVKKGDLVLRDMGYFSATMFQAINNLKAFWLSRLPANVNVEMLDGSKLEKRLRCRSNNMIDEEVFVGNERLRCRLVAVRTDDKLAAQRRRSRKNASKNTPSQQALVRYGWHLLLTNLPEKITKEELFEIYRLRWNIEVRFKAWKQAIRMKDVFDGVSNFYHYESLIYAALIFQLITLNVAASLKIGDRTLSLENLSVAVASILVGIRMINECISFEFDSRHILMERRKRKSLMNQLLTS